MSFKGVRLPVVVTILSLTLALLFGARWLYQNQALDRPVELAVRQVPGVVDVRVTDQGDTVKVAVKAADTPQLEEFVASLWRAIDSAGSGSKVQLQISDSRDAALQNAFYSFHFYLQEAVATGHYSDLPARLSQVAEAAHLSRARVFVGPDYVYLQMHQGDHSLYEVVPRGPLRTGSAASGNGVAEHVVTVGP